VKDARADGQRMAWHRSKLPDFLTLPPVSAKPRPARLTHVLDKGIAPGDLRVLLARFADHVDIWKMGWGTAYLDPDLAEKLAILDQHGVRACTGGTLLEAAWLQGRSEECLAWCSEMAFPCVEVSNGAAGMPLTEKRRLISAAARQFTVLAEVGSKDPAAPFSPEDWAREMLGDVESGATWVITEGRAKGNVGLFSAEGHVREEEAGRLVALAAGKVGIDRVVFEAPQKNQQAWLINLLGADISLGNVPPGDVLALETLRRGLRADTIHLSTRARAEGTGEIGAGR
jgi:phosphosulfolactate synthase